MSTTKAMTPLEQEQFVKQMAEQMARLTAQYESLIKLQRHLIPRYLQNMQFYQPNNTTIQLPYQSQILVRLTSMIVVVSSAGTLSIGTFQMPVTPGMDPLQFGIDGMILDANQDPITLTQTATGPLGLWCFGQEMADRGNRW